MFALSELHNQADCIMGVYRPPFSDSDPGAIYAPSSEPNFMPSLLSRF